jgi:hypothetical protein
MSKQTNERFMSTDDLKRKTDNLRKTVLSSRSREGRLQTKIEKQMLELHDEDNEDILSIMQNVNKDKHVPEDMKLLWEQQAQILQTSSSYGHRWHPK